MPHIPGKSYWGCCLHEKTTYAMNGHLPDHLCCNGNQSPAPQLKVDARTVVGGAVASRAEKLHSVGRFLWDHPETRFEEHKAHDVLCDFLESEGFEVQRHYVLQTAFRAEYGAGSPVVALLCEYDALPGLGHACGHNLIAESALAAAVAVQELMNSHERLFPGSPLQGKVVVLGTPGEEGGMGKELLLRAGAFNDVEAALMVHPENRTVLHLGLSARCTVEVVFAAPDTEAGKALSAMDAAVLAWTNLSLLRARLDQESRMHGVIMRTEATNELEVLRSRLQFSVRSSSTKRLLNIRRDLEACMEAAARATGCQVSVTDRGSICKHMNLNEPLIRLYQRHAETYGMTFEDAESARTVLTGSSSDVGNVSHRLPTLHPTFRIESTVMNHTEEFCRVAGTKESQETALDVGKALALTAYDLLRNRRLLEAAWDYFEGCSVGVPLCEHTQRGDKGVNTV